jgi:hypothetical protein
MFFRRRKTPLTVQIGARYQRMFDGRVSETAQVLSVTREVAGIPHVHFHVHHERPEASDEYRTLALGAFLETFSHPVTV